MALFLASDSARYMCGALVEVNGGKASLMSRFATKICLVTGASRGIGLAIATRLSEEGAHVITAQRGDAPGFNLIKSTSQIQMRSHPYSQRSSRNMAALMCL